MDRFVYVLLSTEKKKAKLKKIKIHSAVFVLLFWYETVAACFYRSSKAEQRVWSSSASLNVLGEVLLSKNAFLVNMSIK